MYLLLLCQKRNISSMSRVNSLDPNRPCTVRTSRQRSCNKGLVVCNNWDIEPLELLNGPALNCYQPSPEVLIVSIVFVGVFMANLTQITAFFKHFTCFYLKGFTIYVYIYPCYIQVVRRERFPCLNCQIPWPRFQNMKKQVIKKAKLFCTCSVRFVSVFIYV